MRVYKIRLDPEDAKYGCSSKDFLNEMGVTYTRVSLDAWKAAWQNTRDNTMKRLPERIREAIAVLRPNLPKLRDDACCERCGGYGRRDDREHWIEHGSLRKVCYKCDGTGIQTEMEPVFFRRRVVDYIKLFLQKGDLGKIDEWAAKMVEACDHVYRPVVIDVIELAVAGDYGSIPKLPH